MNHSDFVIDLEFWCGDKHWRCTDVGTRVIIAICLEPREMVRLGLDREDSTSRTETRYTSTELRDLNGPTYAVVESVFDEYSIQGCNLKRRD